MVSVEKENHRMTSGYFPSQLQRRFYSVSSGWGAKLAFIAQLARGENHGVEPLQKCAFSGGGHVQAVGNKVTLQIFDQPLFHTNIVMTIINRPGAAEEINVFSALVIEKRRTDSFRKN